MFPCNTGWLYVTFTLLSFCRTTFSDSSQKLTFSPEAAQPGHPAGGPHLLHQRLLFLYPRVGGGTHEGGRVITSGPIRCQRRSGGAYKSCVCFSPAAVSESAASLLCTHISVRYISPREWYRIYCNRLIWRLRPWAFTQFVFLFFSPTETDKRRKCVSSTTWRPLRSILHLNTRSPTGPLKWLW